MEGTKRRKRTMFNATTSLMLLIVSLPLVSLSFSGMATADYSARQVTQEFIERMVEKHDFSREELTELFESATKQEQILDLIARPAEAKPWYQYRPIFLTDSRIEGGVQFWQKYAEILEKAEEIYGVPPEIIVAIIGVETRYGAHKGNFTVLSALSTLGFDYPPRSTFFLSELEQLLILSREEEISADELKGSYAGAMGIPQFIASSYRQYAVDFDGDGRRDLINNEIDAIGSVANYFHKHGWRTGGAIASLAEAKMPFDYSGNKLKPGKTIKAYKDLGLLPQNNIPDNALAAHIALELDDGYEHWFGFQNFYVITRYNHSALYAMAVYQLSQEISYRYNLATEDFAEY